MSGKSGSTSQSEPALLGIKVQTSAYGLAVPECYGRNRIPGNLVWYNNFKAIPYEERSEAGKGGGGTTRTSYTYEAACIIALGRGVMGQVRTAWVGKEKITGVSAESKSVVAEELFLAIAHPFTVAHAADYLGTVRVLLTATALEWPDVELRPGVDYTVSNGVYTLIGDIVSQITSTSQAVWIKYNYGTSTDALSALGQIGLTMKAGDVGQSPWPFVTSTYPAESLGYSGTAYVYAQNYAINNSAQLENHNFEIDFQLQYSPSIPDCDPLAVINDILTKRGFPKVNLGDSTKFSQYCIASGLLISPAYLAQRTTRECIEEILDACNSEAAWDGTRLTFVPRGDTTVTGNGVTYTPDNTPLYNLNADAFGSGDDAIVRSITDPRERYNECTVEFEDRTNNYVVTPVSFEDMAAVSMYGRRAESTQGWRVFCDPRAAQQSVMIRVQRQQAAIGTYSFTLSWKYMDITLGTLLTLTFPRLGLSNTPVRVIELTEDVDDQLHVIAEDFPIGHANAPLYTPQTSSGFTPILNLNPGSIVDPFIIEMPGSAVGGTGLGLGIGVSGVPGSGGAYWGGCDIYASFDDGLSYKLIDRVDNPSRIGKVMTGYGTGTGASIDILLAGRGGKMYSVSQADADAQATLCYVGTAEAGEYFTYRDATLATANRYTLGVLNRAMYGTTDRAHLVNEPFMFFDGSIAQSGPLPLSMVGKIIKFKFCSFNIFGAALESLASAPEYSYRVTGRFREQTGRPISANLMSNTTFDAGPVGFTRYFANNDPGTPPAYGAIEERKDASKLQGVPTNLLLAQAGTFPPYQFFVWNDKVAVEDTKRYCAFISLIPHYCEAVMHLRWWDGAGNLLTSESGTLVLSDLTKSPARLDHYSQSGLFTRPPAGARYVEPAVIMWQNPGETSSGVFFTRPYFGEALPEQTEFPVWSAGGVNPVNTRTIAPNATSEFLIFTAPVTNIGGGNRTVVVYVREDNPDPGLPTQGRTWDDDVTIEVVFTATIQYLPPFGATYANVMAWEAQLMWFWGPNPVNPIEIITDRAPILEKTSYGATYQDIARCRTVIFVPKGNKLIVSGDILARNAGIPLAVLEYPNIPVTVTKADITLNVRKGR